MQPSAITGTGSNIQVPEPEQYKRLGPIVCSPLRRFGFNRAVAPSLLSTHNRHGSSEEVSVVRRAKSNRCQVREIVETRIDKTESSKTNCDIVAVVV